MIKNYKTIIIPYWFGRQFVLNFYWLYSESTNKKLFKLTIWEYHKLKDIIGYENEYGSSWWKHFTLWKGR